MPNKRVIARLQNAGILFVVRVSREIDEDDVI